MRSDLPIVVLAAIGGLASLLLWEQVFSGRLWGGQPFSFACALPHDWPHRGCGAPEDYLLDVLIAAFVTGFAVFFILRTANWTARGEP
jgi:hypothetical protein